MYTVSPLRQNRTRERTQNTWQGGLMFPFCPAPSVLPLPVDTAFPRTVRYPLLVALPTPLGTIPCTEMSNLGDDRSRVGDPPSTLGFTPSQRFTTSVSRTDPGRCNLLGLDYETEGGANRRRAQDHSHILCATGVWM